jgi:hypothetical protein
MVVLLDVAVASHVVAVVAVHVVKEDAQKE